MEEAEYCNRLALIYRGKIVALGTPTELKQKHMTGTLLLLECSPLGPALEAVQSIPGVLDAAVFGSALHLVVDSAQESIPRLRSYLAEHNISVSNLEPIRPTLEDVFVALTTGVNGDKEHN
jgi:ABC-2 type transport system ATP-binding protein